jgi:alpha-glucan, water dikinase
MGAQSTASPPLTSGELFEATSTFTSGPLILSAVVTRAADSDKISIVLKRTSPPVQGLGEPLVLHWGIVPGTADDRGAYVRPDKELWPAGTDPRDGEPSVQSPFTMLDSVPELEFSFSETVAPAGLVFLVFISSEKAFRGQWMKGPGGSSFFVDVDSAISSAEHKRRQAAAEEAKKQERDRVAKEEARKKAEAAERDRLLLLEAEQRDIRAKDADAFLHEHTTSTGTSIFSQVDHEYDFGVLSLRAVVPKSNVSSDTASDGEAQDPVPATLVIASTLAFGGASIILHWGVKLADRKLSGWNVPPENVWPENSVSVGDGKALQTKLTPHGEHGLQVAVIQNLPRGVVGFLAVIHVPSNPPHLQWIKGNGEKDIYVPLTPKPPLKGLPKNYGISTVATELVENIIEREMNFGSWTLMHRYSYGNRVVEADIGSDHYAWSAIYVWMRYSQIRVLDWQRQFNTKPRELSHAQLSFVTCLANRIGAMPEIRWLARLVMSCVGRGGSGDLGQRIRDDILVILRHNRGWGHGSMMEQWHQKLHNATDPTDVVICDALLAFWHSNGDVSRYWDVLTTNGVTRERLASYEQAVTSDPDFVGHIKGTMIHELNQYGALLKAVHLGTDLNSTVERCQGTMHGDTRDKVNGFMHARNTGASLVDVLRSVAHARESLGGQISGGLDDHSRRDLLFLDLALESDTRRLVESVSGLGHDGTLWSHLISVRSAARSLKCSETGLKTEGELDRAIHDLQAVIDRLERQGESHDVGLRASAALTIFRNAVTAIVDRYETSLGPIARCMGMAFGAEKDVISTFIEEAVRGGPAFVLSTLLRKAEPAIRRVADLGPYSVIAPHSKETTGPVVVFHKLRESIGAKFKRGTVIVADICDGDEDVPNNTEYVVIGSTVDVLSHVSVRARNEKHGLVACLDSHELARLRSMHGCIVKAKLVGDNFDIEIVDESGRLSPSAGFQPVMKRIRSSGLITPPSGMQTPPSEFLSLTRSASGYSGGILSPGGQALVRKLSDRSLKVLGQQKQAVSVRQLAAPWAIRPSEFNSELVGSKSLNLQRLVALGMADWIKTPISLAIPNGAMRKVLASDQNEDLQEDYNRMVDEISKAKPGDIKLCVQLREVIMSLDAPEGLNEALRGILDDLGCKDIDGALPGAWEAVKGVWASIWNERAHLARQKLRLSVHDVDMAVLCQKVVDADYAFVIHTSNPLTNDKNEIYAECVIGLGETLVGNAPGQSLGFTFRKDEDIETTAPIVRSYPSKTIALLGGEYIFRSDSNAEDLDGFAGAGLHDSIPVVKNRVVDIDYSQERVMTDDSFRTELMRGIAKIGIEVEDVMGGSPQDIEGCFKDGEFYVVQARPQV